MIHYIRLISLFTLCVWSISSSIASPQNQKITIQEDGFSLNGIIEKQYSGTSDITIVYIKDAHCNYESQINSFKIVSYLVNSHDFKLIFNEGSASSLDTTDISSFPLKNALQNVSLYFLKNGYINGIEYYNLLNPTDLSIEGIEDRTLYNSNYAAFYKSMSFRKKGAEYNATLSAVLEQLKQYYYSEKLLLLDEQAEAYHEGEITVFDFFEILLSYSEEFSIQFAELENISLLDKALSHHHILNTKEVEQEKNALTDTLLKLATPTDKKDITRTLLQFEFHTLSPDGLNEYLAQKCDEYLIDLDDFPLFSHYLAYSRLLKQIDQESLIAELDYFFEKIKKPLYSSPETSSIDRLCALTHLIGKAFSLTLTPDQNEQLLKALKRLDIQELTDFIESSVQAHNIPLHISLDDIKYITFAIEYVNEFYSLAHQRNMALVDNSLRLLKEHNQKKAILYIGGFHTNEICSLLEKNDISYFVIKPKTSLFPSHTPFTYLLSNVENNFIKSLESNIRSHANNTLALASRLVPPSESLTEDAYNIEAFRQQLKALYLTGGIREAVEPIHKTILPFAASLNDDRLAELSDKIADILAWRNIHFKELQNFSLHRNQNNGIDLEFTIFDETYIVPYLISDAQRKEAFAEQSESAHPLLTINYAGYPLSIAHKKSSLLANQFTFAGFSDENIAQFIQPFIKQPVITESDLLQLSSLPLNDAKRLILLLKSKGIIAQKPDKQLSLVSPRSSYYTTASRLFQLKHNKWVAVSELDTSLFPENFRAFLEQKNITRIELPNTITFSALLFMLETFSGVKDSKTFFPKDNQINFIFSVTNPLGSRETHLIIREQNTIEREVIFRERKYLLGAQYDAIIERQLFGVPASQSTYLVLPVLPPAQEINIPDSHGVLRSIRLASPSISEKMWREINDISINYDPLSGEFKSSGGLLFGYELGSEYVITAVIPLDEMDYANQTDTSFTVDAQHMDELLSEYAVNGIKLLGQYHTHSPERISRGIQPGIGKSDIMRGYPYNVPNDKIAATPLGIAFALSPRQEETGSLNLSSLTPDHVKIFFYLQTPNYDLTAYALPALDFVPPGESAFETSDIRFISLNTEKVTQTQDTRTLATFQRLNNNRGFLLTTNGKLPQPQMQQLVQFFHSIRLDLEEYPEVKDISIVRGPHIAHANKNDRILEFNEALLNYPRVLHYLALPHEWNHFILNLDEATEEVIAVMLDLHRFAEFYLVDTQTAESFLDELRQFEQPIEGRRLFHSVLSVIKQRILTSRKVPSPTEILVIAKQYIRSMPDLLRKTQTVLSKDAHFFIDPFTDIIAPATPLPLPLLPGADNLVVFDESQLTQPEEVFRTSLGNEQSIALRYITLEEEPKPTPLHLVGAGETEEIQSEKDDQEEKETEDSATTIRELSASIPYEINFADSLGTFDPNTPSIVINLSSQLHQDSNGNPDPNMILATIIRQRTHLLLHHNQPVLDAFVDIMNDEPHIKDSVLKLFLTLRKERPFEAVSEETLEQLAHDPVYSKEGNIDYAKILNALISTANGFNAIKNTYLKLLETKQQLLKKQQEIPQYLENRIAQLKAFTGAKQYQAMFYFSQETEEFLRRSDRNLARIFQISTQTTLHILDITDEHIAESKETHSGAKIYHVDFRRDTSPATKESGELEKITSPPSEQLSTRFQIDGTAESAFSVTTNQANDFLSLMNYLSGEPLPNTPPYTKEIAYENAREFYEFLIKKHRESPQTALPVTISVVDIYLGTPEYAKDFLDHFKALDEPNNLFYKRLKYHIASHSAASSLMLQEVEHSDILAGHSDAVQFDYFETLRDKQMRSATENALLVRAFGNTVLFNDALAVEKSSGKYNVTHFIPNFDATEIDGQTKEAVISLILDPSHIKQFPDINNLKSIVSKLTWNKSEVPIEDITTLPFGNFLQSYTEHIHALSGRFIIHPSLLELVRTSLSGMNTQYGGYWQLFGNELTTFHPALQEAVEQRQELDSNALELIMAPHDNTLFSASGKFIHETPEEYLLHRTSHQPFAFTLSILFNQLASAPHDSLELAMHIIPPFRLEYLSALSKITELRRQPQFVTSTPETFKAFYNILVTRGLVPTHFPIQYIKAPSGQDDFLYSIEHAFVQQTPQLHKSIVDALIILAKEAVTAPIVSEEDFFTRFESQASSTAILFSRPYLLRIIQSLYDLYKSKNNIHLHAEIAPSISAVSDTANLPDTPQSREPQRVRVRKLSHEQFKEYLANVRAELQHEYPELDFDNPRALANPLKNEIVYNGEHSEHLFPDGSFNIAELLQTIYHEKAHMLIFSRWDTLDTIVKNLEGRDYEKNRIVELFLQFKGAGQFIRTKDELSRSPIWSRNGKIDYARVLSELLALINQYQSIPLIIDHLGKTDRQYRSKNKATPQMVLKSIQHIFTALDQRVYLTETVNARRYLTNLDPLFDNLLFSSRDLRGTLQINGLLPRIAPLPSTPIRTVFSDEEVEHAINTQWSSLPGKKESTRLTGLQIPRLQTVLETIETHVRTSEQKPNRFSEIVAFWRQRITEGKIYITPSTAGNYSIIGTHFIHETSSGDIVISEGYFSFLHDNNLLPLALSHFAAKKIGIPTENFDRIFDSPSIEDVNHTIYENYIRNTSYLPIIRDIMSIYGIDINNISLDALTMIISRYTELVSDTTSPQLTHHVNAIKELLRDVQFTYSTAVIADAFDVYAQHELNTGEINELYTAVLEIGAILERQARAPIVFLIDKNTLTGTTNAHNMEIRQTLAQIRTDIETLEQRNVVLIAVDTTGTNHSAISDELNARLLRKGASADDFDYIVSYNNPDDLLTALKQEFHDFSDDELKQNIKIFAESHSALVSMAQQHELQFQAIDESSVTNQEERGEGIFLVDYLRSLGLSRFFAEDSEAPWAIELKQAMHIVNIQPLIDLTDIASEQYKDDIAAFARHIEQSAEFQGFNTILPEFLHKLADEGKGDVPAIITDDPRYTAFTAQYALSITNKMYKELQRQSNEPINAFLALYAKLESAYHAQQDTHPTYSSVIERFFSSLDAEALTRLQTKFSILTETSEKGKTTISQTDLPNLFIGFLIRTSLLSPSELFILEKRIKDTAIQPVPLLAIIQNLQTRGIEFDPASSRYLAVEIAPKKIEKSIKSLIATQRLFEESA
ncbi:MAG: hypothetical protein H7A34_08490 [bacterium]|nr:hypothetical protein [bacterium]